MKIKINREINHKILRGTQFRIMIWSRQPGMYMEKVIMKKIAGLFIILTVIMFYSCQKHSLPSAEKIEKIKPYDSAAFEYVFVEAIKQKLLGNSGDALRYLEQCLKINPSSDAAYFHMAQVLFAQGDITTGKKCVLKAQYLAPTNFWYLMMLAGTYYQEQNIDSAIIFYEKAAELCPDKTELQLTLGNLYSENKKYDKAGFIFEALDKKYGTNNTSTVSAVKNLMRAGKYDDAERKVQLLLEESPGEILYNGLLAEIYRGKGNSEKAMEVYNKLIERNPGNPETQLSLCEFLLNEKKYEDLINLLNTVVLNENILREDKISLFAKLIENEEIVKSYSDKLQLSLMVLEASADNDYVVLLLRPELLIAHGELKKAASRLEEIIVIYPENYYAWEKLLLVYLQDKNYKKLQERGEECSSKFNRSFLAKILYATGAEENGSFDIALDELRKAAILAGDNKEMLLQVLTLKADVYYRMKDFERAFRAFDEALKANNKDLTVLNNYAYYLAEQNTRLKEAEVMAKEVIEKERSNITFLDTYAWVLYKRGKVKAAGKIMEEVLKNAKEPDAEFFEHYGYILRKSHDCRNAVTNWNAALQLDSTKKELLIEIEKCKNYR